MEGKAMEKMTDFIKVLTDWSPPLVIVFTILASVGLAATKALFSRSILFGPDDFQKDPSRAAESKAEEFDLFTHRYEEVDKLWKQQDKLAAFSIWGSRLLTFLQFIVGGLLATSFIQDSL